MQEKVEKVAIRERAVLLQNLCAKKIDFGLLNRLLKLNKGGLLSVAY